MSVKDSAYTRLTGTSMATPHVAGAVALLLSLYNSSEEISVAKPPAYEKVLQSLTETTTRKLHKPFLVPSECGNTTYQEYRTTSMAGAWQTFVRQQNISGFHALTPLLWLGSPSLKQDSPLRSPSLLRWSDT